MNSCSKIPLVVFLSLLSLTSMLFVQPAFAQEPPDWKRLESNLMLGGGLFLESGSNADDPGITLRVSYGLDCRFNDRWSFMPGAGLRAQVGDIRHLGWIGGDFDSMSQVDFFLTLRYHLPSDHGSRMVLGLGPALSYMIAKDTYYIDADPNDPLNGKEKFKHYDLGLQPSLTILRGKHFQWGFEANIGLLNALRPYPEYHRTGSIHLHYLTVSCGWRF